MAEDNFKTRIAPCRNMCKKNEVSRFSTITKPMLQRHLTQKKVPLHASVKTMVHSRIFSAEAEQKLGDHS
jgi:hypothetical protein